MVTASNCPFFSEGAYIVCMSTWKVLLGSVLQNLVSPRFPDFRILLTY